MFLKEALGARNGIILQFASYSKLLKQVITKKDVRYDYEQQVGVEPDIIDRSTIQSLKIYIVIHNMELRYPSSFERVSLDTPGYELNEIGNQPPRFQRPGKTGSRSSKFFAVCSVTIILVVLVLWMKFTAKAKTQVSLDEMVPSYSESLYYSIPKKVWKYRTAQTHQPTVSQMSSLNQHFVTQASFEVTIIDDTNFEQYLNSTTTQELISSLQEFEKIVKENSANSELEQRWRVMAARIKVLHVLEARGGVMLDQSLSLTQSLAWIYDIDTNPYANRVNRQWPTQVIGFLDARTSSERVKYPTNELISAPFKFARERPSLSPALIAARKNAYFISKLCLSFRKALRDGDNLLEYLKYPNYSLNSSYQFLMQSRAVMDELHQQTDPAKRTLLVDTIGLSLINSYYGPDKLSNQVREYQKNVPFNFYGNITLEQLQQLFGPFRYGVYLKQYDQFQNLFKGSRKVMEKSLVHHLLPSLGSDSLFPDPEVSTADPNAPEWVNLPKVVWTIWLTGYESAYITNKLTFAIMKQRFQSRGYTVNLVTLENARSFVGDETMDELERIYNNKKYPRFMPTMSDLLRLVLVVKHGGVYMDMSSLLTGDIDWIRNIAHMPSHLILNRFSQLPKVVYSFNFFLPQPPFWQINPKTHTKQGLVANYENFFIVAEKNNEYLKLVLQWYMKMLETSHEDITKYVLSLGLNENALYVRDGPYLLEMQMMQTVLMEKQRQLDSSNSTEWINAAHYYGVWSIFSPFVPSKYWRDHNHLDDFVKTTNPYFYSYSTDYTYGLIGKPSIPYVKLLGEQSHPLTSIYRAMPPSITNISQGLHPHSELRKAMDEFGLEIIRRSGDFQLVSSTKR